MPVSPCQALAKVRQPSAFSLCAPKRTVSPSSRSLRWCARSSTRCGSSVRLRTDPPASGTRPKFSRNMTSRSRGAWRAAGSSAGSNRRTDKSIVGSGWIERRDAFNSSEGGSRSAVPHLFLSFDELAIIGSVEIKQCPTRSKVLDENHANRVRSAGRQRRHHDRANNRSDDRHTFYYAYGSNPTAHRNHRPCKAGYKRFALVFGKRNAVNLRNTAQHLNLNPTDGSQVDHRHRNKSGSPRPQRETFDQFHRMCMASL